MVKFLRPVSIIAQTIFVLFLAWFTLKVFSYHFSLVAFPYPVGLREGAMMTTTDALIKGLNPYAFALQPRFMNQYGIVYPLLVFPLAKLFGTTMFVHRLVSALMIFASCILIFFVQRKLKIPLLLNIWAFLMLYSSLIYPGTSTPTIDPGGTGTFFFLLSIFIPWFCDYSYRSLILSILCGIIAFYTKAYVVLGVFIMASFLFLFVSKRKGLFYGALLLILSVISIAAVNRIFPAYFDNCFFTSVNMAPAWSSMERLHEQIVKYWALHQWIFILIGVHILWFGYKKSKDSWPQSIKLIVYAALCSSFVLYMSLGRHSGAMMWYFFQLLSPFLLVIATWTFSRHNYWPFFCVPFLIISLHTMTLDHDPKIFDKKIADWPQLAGLLEHHQQVLNSSLIAPLLIQENKDIVDDGQAEYFGSGGQRNYWMKGWLKEDSRVYLQLTLFFENIREMVENKKYDLIILQPSLLPMGVAEDIRRYYKCEGEFSLKAPQDQRAYAMSIWLPK